MSDLSKEEFEKLKREVDQAHAESERANHLRREEGEKTCAEAHPTASAPRENAG